MDTWTFLGLLGNGFTSQCDKMDLCTPLIVEAEATGVLMAHEMIISNLIIKGDILVLINILPKLYQRPWNIQFIINDIHHIILTFSSVHIP